MTPFFIPICFDILHNVRELHGIPFPVVQRPTLQFFFREISKFPLLIRCVFAASHNSFAVATCSSCSDGQVQVRTLKLLVMVKTSSIESSLVEIVTKGRFQAPTDFCMTEIEYLQCSLRHFQTFLVLCEYIWKT